MSAYVVNKSVIDALVRFAANSDVHLYAHYCGLNTHGLEPREILNLMGRALWSENVRSVRYRYPRSADAIPGPTLPAGKTWDEILANYQLELTYSWSLDPIGALTLAGEIAYQSCETDDYEDSTACKLLLRIERAAISRLEGYGESPIPISHDYRFSGAEVPEMKRKEQEVVRLQKLHAF